MSTETITAGQDTTISVGNGNNTVNVIGGSQDTITIGNGSNTLTVTGGTDDTITAGSGNDKVTVTGGSDNTITAGNGNVTVVASGDQGDTITVGMGNDTVDLGANDTLDMGKGSELVVLPSSTPTLAVASITVSEDQTVSLAGLGISAGVSALGFGQENIYGFAAADQLEFTTAQFANFTAVMADATQVGRNTVITDSSSDTITLENVAKSSLSAKNFLFVNAGSSSATVLVTITGLPSDLGGFNGGTYTASTGTWTGTAAQFDALTFNAGEETSAQLTVTATDTTTGYSISKAIELTVTPPAINIAVNGVAQEGHTLSAAVTVSNGDAFTYQWQSSSDGTHWNNIVGAGGANYQVQERDENLQLRVEVTLVDDSYSVASTATSAVLDAAPTVTVPIITGTAQEGQTLTASASSGQSDNPVSYAWYSSADGYTNPIGTGASYLVQEGDENHTIEVKATATNDNGVQVSAASAATSSVIDNASISLAVSVVAGGTVQQGQTLVATATISGDADDSTAAVTYQWQSSGDGGATWTNVAATASGDFNNGALSSFYQMTEADEGKLFRAQASFTDDTGQVLSTTSAPTAPVADVTPEITVPFTYAVDDLSISKNGTQIYNDTFSTAPIVSPTILSNGVATPIVFITQGSTWTESGGKAIASSTDVAANPNITGSTFDLALLDTNTDPTSTKGLKLGADFTVSSTFDLTTPPTGGYGMELTDGTSTHGVDQLERLIVQRVNGNAVVELIQANLTTNTQTVVASHTLTGAELAGNTQIEFQMSHAANTTAVSGTFELIDNGVVTSTTTFGSTASIFTNGIDWTRVDVGAFTSTGVGLNLAPGASPREGQTLTASASTNDSDATLHYQWQESSNGTQWSNIGTDSASYVVQESDEGLTIRVVASTTDPDNNQTTSVTSATTGPVLDALPTVTAPIITGTAQEGQTLTASASSGQSDNPVSYSWYSSADGFTNPIGTGAAYLVQEGDEGFTVEAKATATNENGVTISATSVTSPVLDALPTVTVPVITGTAQEGQTLTASASSGQSDNPVSYAWYSSADGFTNPVGTGATYLVQEGDEGFTIEAKATATNDNGVTISATSVTSGVLDALPTVTVPIITGTAQEGQTLTASASSGQSDNPVSYAWYSSADGFTNPIGTGATYLVQEGDEGFTIEAKATATNDNGVTISATSVTSGVLDALPTVTVPIITGAAQEGQTLTASASSGQSDNPVSYAWYSSADGFTNPVGTGATYLVQEGDEGFTIEAKATATNDNGVTISATSVTSGVLDALPTVTVPIITGAAQEGQTLTASASSGQSDNPVSYAWYSSADGFTNPIGTGATYLVQEGDEGFTIEAKATATNDNGVTASAISAATSSVIDDASISFAVSIVDNLPVQQGQTLVATATITGDADDSTAPITYQWQSSSDGGQTWSNVGGALAGNFDNGQPSSFLQLTEANEGQEFRAQASFTDDTGQVVSTTSAPSAPVTDVTPEITVPFSYTVDDLSIVKTVSGTPTQIYDDTFGQAPPASPTILSNGVATPIVFLTLGSTWTESGGQAVLSSTGVAPNEAIAGGTEDIALLDTNTDPSSTLGLKQGATFTVSSTFGLTAPPTGSYGMELNDGTSTHGVDQLERLIVTQSGGNTVVELVQRDLASNPQTTDIIASQTLTAAQLAADNQIEFQFTHASGAQTVTGSFELLDNGVVDTNVGTVTLGTSPIFTNGVDWTRVDIGAFTNPGVGLNVGAGQSPLEGQTLTASATTNDSDATLHYQWQESSSQSFTTFTDIGTDSSSYVVQESDVGSFIRVVASTSDPDNSQSATATSQVTGAVTPVAPALSVSNVTLSEDSSAGFPITVTPFNPNDPIGISISGIPSDVSLSDNAGPLTIAGGSVTLTPAQLAGLTLTAGAAESATLTVTATNEAGATKSVSQLVNLDATPVAPTISISPAGVSVNEDGTVALPITVTPFDPRDSVSVVIGGIPPGGTLKDGVGDTFAGGGLPATLTLAQFDSGVSLTVGPQIPATPDQLTVQAYNNSNGVASVPLQFLPVTVDPVAPALLAPATLSVNEDSSASLPITVTPFDASDNVLVTIAGLPSDATLTDGDNDRFTGGQSWTLSLAQVDSGLTLNAGEDTTTNLTVTATNEGGPALGQMASTSQSIALTVNPVSEGPVLGGNKSGSFIEGALVTLGATDTVADIDDTLGNVTITDLPADLTNVNGGAYTPGTGTWTGTAAQFSALSFNAGEQGTYMLSISAATTGAEAGITTESYMLTVNPVSEGPLLGGAMSATVSEGGSVTFGATDTVSDGDDTLGNVTITGLPHDLTGFTGGGTYTAGTGTWTGTAAQFGALSFKAGEKGIFNLSVAATTTGAEAGTTTGSYTLTINPAAPVLGGATSADVNPLNTVTFGATDTPAFADDTLGNVTISGLPGDLTNFNGGTYTAGTGTWTGTAAQFNALSFKAGAAGIHALSISATTTGATAPTTENYTLTINAPPVITGTTATGSVPSTGLTATAAADLTTGHLLVNNLGTGGATGFGTVVSFNPDYTGVGGTRTDDGSTNALSLTSVFGSQGLDFFGTSYTSLYINNNGNLTFTGPNSSYVPSALTSSPGNPIIAPFWADVDTRGGVIPASVMAPLISAGDHGSGSNQVWESLDTVNHVLTITWDDVGSYAEHTSPVNAFQVQLIGLGSGNFDILFRYETINWTSGDASGGAAARAGFTAANNNPEDYFELPGSGASSSMLALPTTIGNTGIAGVDVFQVESGSVTNAPVANGNIQFSDPDPNDTHTASFTPDGTGYLGTFSLDPIVESNGTGSVAWHFTLASNQVQEFFIPPPGHPLTQSYEVKVTDNHGAATTEKVGLTVGTASSDTFVYAPGGGQQLLFDYSGSADKIELEGFGISSFSQLTLQSVNNGNDTLISLSPTDSLTVVGVSASSLSAANFILSASIVPNLQVIDPTVPDTATVIPLSISDQPVGQDATLLPVTISGLRPDWTLTDSGSAPTNLGNGTWAVAADSLAGLEILAPAGGFEPGTVTLTATASSLDAAGNETSTSSSFDVNVIPNVNWTNGGISSADAASVAAGGALTVGDPVNGGLVTLGSELDIAGQASISAATDIELGVPDADAPQGYDPGTLSILSGGALSMADGVTINGNGGVDNGIVNAGTLTKTGAATSTIGVALANSGTIDVQGGTLSLNGNVQNLGTLEADGGSIVVDGTVTGGGSATINGATLEFAAASDSAVSFTGTAGTLLLDQSASFTGSVSQLASGDNLDLADIGFGTSTTIGYSGDGKAGTLTVSDGTNTANIALLGQYMASSFATASDGHGGTLISDPSMSTQPPQLTQAHA